MKISVVCKATFEELAQFIFKLLPNSPVVHFVTDMYWECSIKNIERHRRGLSDKLYLDGPKMKVPRDFAKFLRCAANKIRLLEILLIEWSSPKYASQINERKIFFVCSSDSVNKVLFDVPTESTNSQTTTFAQCLRLQNCKGESVDVTHEKCLDSSQEEADTRLALHALFADENEPGSTIVVRSPDTDVLVILLYYCQQFTGTLLFETGVGNKRRFIDVKKIQKSLGASVCQALPAFHAFTGCDSVSAFVRKGKRGPFKILSKSYDYQKSFTNLGETLTLSDKTSKTIEKFVCALYGKEGETSVNSARFSLFTARYGTRDRLSLDTGIDISLLPPCKTSLQLHILRANYQAYIWKHAHVPDIELPSPTNQGWKLTDGGLLDINWTDDQSIPESLAAIVCESDEFVRPLDTIESCNTDVLEMYCDLEEDDVFENIVDLAGYEDGE